MSQRTSDSGDLPNSELRERYVAGRSIRALCTETGLAYGTVHRRLLAAGVELRPRGGQRKASKSAEAAEIEQR